MHEQVKTANNNNNRTQVAINMISATVSVWKCMCDLFSHLGWNFCCLPSMQRALHQLSGYGVPDRTSGCCQGHIWDTGCHSSTCCHCCALQGIFTRHHADRQPEEVSLDTLYLSWRHAHTQAISYFLITFIQRQQALFHWVHHAALQCFYSGPEWTKPIAGSRQELLYFKLTVKGRLRHTAASTTLRQPLHIIL